MSNDFGPELRAAHNEEMTKLVGRYVTLAIFTVGFSVTTCLFVTSGAGDPCTLCLEAVDCRYKETPADALEQCVKLCPKEPQP